MQREGQRGATKEDGLRSPRTGAGTGTARKHGAWHARSQVRATSNVPDPPLFSSPVAVLVFLQAAATPRSCKPWA